jgi:hypothetical protein
MIARITRARIKRRGADDARLPGCLTSESENLNGIDCATKAEARPIDYCVQRN